MKFLLICDYRENFTNYSHADMNNMYNDHPSKKNINEIIDAIKALGYDCDYFGGIPELVHAVDTKKTFEDCIFLNFTDGMDEEYSRIQAPALLEILKVPYSGSGVFPSALMNNKHFCKKALLKLGIAMSKSCIVNHEQPINCNQLKDWKFPLFVKPNCEGSSLGISKECICHTIDDVISKSSELLNNFEEIIIEEYINGIDITNYLIGNNDSYLVNSIIIAELFDKSPFAIYGIDEKQNKLRKLFIDDEYLPINLVKKIKKQSILIAHTLGVHDICRIDYRVNLSSQEIFFIEINSAPRFSTTSEIGFIAKKHNISFVKMVQYYLTAVLERLS
jgi:D-alanine-D-alanine ligase